MRSPVEIATKIGLPLLNAMRSARRRPIQTGSARLVAILLLAAQSVLAQSNAHRFGTITPQSDQSLSLELLGTAPPNHLKYFDVYPLEASTNLVDWTPLEILVRTNSATNALVYRDTDAPGFSHRFYRTPTNHFVTPLVKPSGPYAVGRVTRVLTDTSRTNRYGIRSNSSFMVTLWYPAVAVPGSLPGAYIDPQLAVPLAEPHLGSSGDVASRLTEFVAFSRPNAPVASAGSPFPVVIYSHGYTFHRQENSDKLEELASHGFVAVSMDHADCRTTVYPDGTTARGVFTDTPSEAIMEATAADRLADDRFVLKALEQLNTSDTFLSGRLDLTRLGAMGWSLGSSDLGLLAQTDSRFKGIVVLEGYLQAAPGLLETLLQQGWRLPLLAMYEEGFSDTALFQQATANATQDEYFCLVHVTSHFAFKDLTEASLTTDSARRGAKAMRACMLSFFSKYLKGQDNHLLDNPTQEFPILFNFVKRQEPKPVQP